MVVQRIAQGGMLLRVQSIFERHGKCRLPFAGQSCPFCGHDAQGIVVPFKGGIKVPLHFRSPTIAQVGSLSQGPVDVE